MQVTTFGSPSPARPGALPFAFGGDAGFAQALGFALQGNPQGMPAMPDALSATATGTAPVATDDAAQLSALGQTSPATPLAQLQGPTNLSQLMATASTLPAAAEGQLGAKLMPIQPVAAPVAAEVAQPGGAVDIDVSQPAVDGNAKPVPGKAGKPQIATPNQADEIADILAEEPAAPVAQVPVENGPKKVAVAETEAGPRKPVPAAKDEAKPEQGEAVAQLPQAQIAVAAQPVVARHAVPTKADSQPQLVIDAKRGAVTQDMAQANVLAAADGNAVTGVADGNGNTANTGTGGEQPQQQDPKASFTAKLDAVLQPAAAHATSPIAAPVEAPRTEPVIAARQGHVGQALGVEIARKVEAGAETLRVRLSPEHLGKIEVTLAFDDGKLQATVRTESAHALDLLRQDAPDLARTLDQAGIRTDAQSFRFEARADTGGQSSPQHQQQRGNQTQQHAAADDLEPAPAYRALRADGQVDLIA